MASFVELHIYGDNIVECERTVTMIQRAFRCGDDSKNGPFGSPICPQYKLTITSSLAFHLILYPGHGRWSADVNALLQGPNARLREKADILITRASKASSEEVPLLFIEYCSALLAGNQAWQRNGRAYSLGIAGLPYAYIAELGGIELAKNRIEKEKRLPNPAIPFSFVTFSRFKNAPSLIVFEWNPAAKKDFRKAYAGVYGMDEFLGLLCAVLRGRPIDHAVGSLNEKALLFGKISSTLAKKKNNTLTPALWEGAHRAVSSGQPLVSFLVDKAPLAWAKKVSIKVSRSFDKLLEVAKTAGIGLTSGDLPVCIIPNERRSDFANNVEAIYGEKLTPKFYAWLRRSRNLTICWVNGFKPQGDDSRPDRGLVPFVRMMVGEEEDILTVVFGPAKKAAWSLLQNNPKELIRQNGLWQSVLNSSDTILVDSITSGAATGGYFRQQPKGSASRPKPPVLPLVEPMPLRFGEDDVDTVLHLIFSQASFSFEGSCNPPGGDWSGLSLLSRNQSKEYRWLTLPRVGRATEPNESAAGKGQKDKRPDHVAQMFPKSGDPIILCVESKDVASRVEPQIGPRLVSFVQALLKTPPNVERLVGGPWIRTGAAYPERRTRFASAIAFLSTSGRGEERALDCAQADLLLSVEIDRKENGCLVNVTPRTDLGQEVATLLCAFDGNQVGIRVARK